MKLPDWEISHLDIGSDLTPPTFVRYYDWATRLGIGEGEHGLKGSLRYFSVSLRKMSHPRCLTVKLP